MAFQVKLGTPISKLMKHKSSPFDLDDNLGYFGFVGFLGFVVTNDGMIFSSENKIGFQFMLKCFLQLLQ
jgi:hypothetical protein